ncbi:hypothetical protein Ddye_019133 [Dipteronia dyeriana]|uniref:F-box domain-containing protein n=1 Tax=Dipteronia dyeriana TaxID=168575 RepID=A0AAD9WVD0_9ROSI|nr:hypothetical protein Ddye_019133 [Dipteronia dyeriana]
MDRLSNLPDNIIHEILSRLPTKTAVKTCVLSKRWKHQWRQTDSLSFNCGDFLENNASYNFIHQRLEELKTNIFPPMFFEFASFASLKTLELCGVEILDYYQFDCIFSKIKNLENLELIDWRLGILETPLNIKSRSLVNLTISEWGGDILVLVISAPRLNFFYFDSVFDVELIKFENCVMLEKANIKVPPEIAWRETNYPNQGYTLEIMSMYRLEYNWQLSVSLNFCKGKFISCCAAENPLQFRKDEPIEEGKEQRMWFLDGDNGDRNLPSYWKELREHKEVKGDWKIID